jgi:hypothetical protein
MKNWIFPKFQRKSLIAMGVAVLALALAIGITWYVARAHEPQARIPHRVAPGQQVRYVASKNGQPFHLPGCASAKKISPENLETFTTREEAIAAGHVPCKVCKP